MLLTHCAGLEQKDDSRVVPNTLQEESVVKIDSSTRDFHSPQYEKDENISKLDPMNHIPDENNPLVHKWIEYFQGPGREHMKRYLSRSTKYLTLMKKILSDHGLPEDLVYVALIESGFQSSVRSRARAVGYWQFIKGTARRYGLRMNNYIDERRDPVKSTEAAARYLKGLYHVFGNWYLAIAAYNSGENRIKNAVMSTYTRDFWDLARANLLADETVNYVPKFLAARLIAQDPSKYGFDQVTYEEPMQFDTIVSSKSVDLRRLAKAMNISYDDLKQLNASIIGSYAPVSGQGVFIKVPPGSEELAKIHLGSSFVADKKIVEEMSIEDEFLYKIRPGDNLGRIAKKFSTTVSALCSINGFTRRTVLRAGRQIKIPGFVSEKKSGSLKQRDKGFITSHEKVHFVRKGDTLLNIARKYRVALPSLMRRNQIPQQNKLLAGSKVIIPGLLKK